MPMLDKTPKRALMAPLAPRLFAILPLATLKTEEMKEDITPEIKVGIVIMKVVG